MRKQFFALAVLFFCSSHLWADEKATRGTIISEKSVDCGTNNKGKKHSTAIVCQQYTVRTTTLEYQIRQQKPGEAEILPPNTPIDFTVDKDKMKFKVNGKKYEFLIVGSLAIGTPGS